MVSNLVLVYFAKPRLVHTIKANYKNLDCWSRDMLNFDFSRKDLRLASLPHFVYNFWRKMFFMVYSINWANFIVWLSLLREILGNICLVIICCPVYDVINVEINCPFFTKPFFYISKSQEKNVTWNKKCFS